jgi:hypothetical protein
MPTAREIALGVARQRIPRGVMADVIDELWREQPGPMSRLVRVLEDRPSGSVRPPRQRHPRSPFRKVGPGRTHAGGIAAQKNKRK